MFSKGLLVFGFLAIFVCQVSNVQSIETLEQFNTQSARRPRSTLGDLIDQVKEVISNLQTLVNGVIGDALNTLTNLASVIQNIREKYLDEGTQLISGSVGQVTDYIKNRTNEASELGVDISACVNGREDQLQDLQNVLVANLSSCVQATTDSIASNIKQDITVINQIVRNITSLPVRLSKCLISLRPIACVTQLLADSTAMLTSLPAQIKEMVDNAQALVEGYPTYLQGCVVNIRDSAQNQTQQIIQDIGQCVDNIIGGATTTLAS